MNRILSPRAATTAQGEIIYIFFFIDDAILIKLPHYFNLLVYKRIRTDRIGGSRAAGRFCFLSRCLMRDGLGAFFLRRQVIEISPGGQIELVE
jgi:hypothetical protein